MSTSQEKMTGELFSEELIFQQLQKIYLCPVFSVSEILQRFLSYISQEALAGRSNMIKEYTIAVHVLNKPISFKPQHDAIVRIHAGRLRRALLHYYREFGQGDKIEITVPKGSYVPVFKKQGIAKSENQGLLSQENENAEKIKLAVLPFSTLETEMSRISFADSLGLQLSSGLAQYTDFSVVSYYATRQLSFRKKEIQTLAREFGARFILTGDVLFENRKLKVLVQLTDSVSGVQIWSENYSYNNPASGLFAASDDITNRILACLGDFNGLIVREISKGLMAPFTLQPYKSTLAVYHDFYSDFNERGFKKAYASMEATLESNPYDEVAWSFLGQLTLMAELFEQPMKENAEILALRYARKAIKINPDSQIGYLTLGMVHIFLGNRQISLEALENAIRLNPQASGQMGIIGCLLISAGDYHQGMTCLKTSMELNKYFPPLFYYFTSLYYYKLGQYSKALEEQEKSGLNDDTSYQLMRLYILVQLGRKSEAEILVKSLDAYALHKIWNTRAYMNKLLLDTELREQMDLGFKTIRVPLLTVA